MNRDRSGTIGEVDVLWIEGQDAERFLNGVLTSDVGALDDGGFQRALLLSVKGRVLADTRVLRDSADAFTLVTQVELGPIVAAQLSHHLVSEDAVVIGPEHSPVLSLYSGERPRRDGEMVVPGSVDGTWDVVCDDPLAAARALGVSIVDEPAWDALRVAAGSPRIGIDVAPDTTLVQELGLAESHVSMTKGCYLGQETVARVASRGRVQRHLRGVLLDRPVASGSELSHDGAVVGRLISSAVHPTLGAIGLALVRREVEPGQDVSAGDGSGRVTTLPLDVA